MSLAHPILLTKTWIQDLVNLWLGPCVVSAGVRWSLLKLQRRRWVVCSMEFLLARSCRRRRWRCSGVELVGGRRLLVRMWGRRREVDQSLVECLPGKSSGLTQQWICCWGLLQTQLRICITEWASHPEIWWLSHMSSRQFRGREALGIRREVLRDICKKIVSRNCTRSLACHCFFAIVSVSSILVKKSLYFVKLFAQHPPAASILACLPSNINSLLGKTNTKGVVCLK